MKTTTKTILTALVTIMLPQWLAPMSLAANQVPSTQKTVTQTSLRDPFWPVGFTPIPTKVKEIEKKRSQLEKRIKWPKLELKGITRTSDNRYIAVIKGVGLVETGDTISAKKDGLIYRWRITAITKAGISRKRLDVKEVSTNLQKRK